MARMVHTNGTYGTSGGGMAGERFELWAYRSEIVRRTRTRGYEREGREHREGRYRAELHDLACNSDAAMSRKANKVLVLPLCPPNAST